MYAAAHAVRVDLQNSENQSGTQQRILIRLCFPFFHFLANAWKSPLQGSLRKLQLDSERWRHILKWPLVFSELVLKELAQEAHGHVRSFATLAATDARTAFDESIARSLEEG